MSTICHPLTIGPLRLPGNLFLAPLAGTSDLGFRRICARLGADLSFTELVSARGIVHDPKLERNWRYLAIDPDAGAMAIQLFGAEPEDFRRAVMRIVEHPVLARCACIDINMGCPVPKVKRTGAGSALLNDPGRAARIVAACVAVAAPADIPVTAKIRAGVSDNDGIAPVFARELEAAGAEAITVHARSAQRMYAGQADWSVIAAVRRAVRIPVIGNGDVRTASDARRLVEQTGADGIMIGRAAQGDPWVFARIKAELAGRVFVEPSWDERLQAFFEQLDGLAGQLGEAIAVREMRRQLPFYLRGRPGVAGLRALAMRAQTRAEVAKILEGNDKRAHQPEEGWNNQQNRL